MNTIAALIMGLAAAVLVTALLGFAVIPWLRKLHFGQTILDIGPKWHEKKQGTPTMGGIMFILGTIAAVAVTVVTDKLVGGNIVASSATGAPAAELYTKFYSGIIFALGVALIGFADDYIKVVKKRNLGLKAKQKMLGQILIAIVTMIVGTRVLGIDTTIWIPIADINLDIGIGYYFLVLFVLVGTSNAVNLTDGLDGLASGTVAIASGAYALVCYMTGHFDLALFCVAMMMACQAFLRFNAHPAKVFMGDTGSLALGGAIAAVGILTHTEILLAVIGFVFVCEALSVIIQVISFKTTGKRVFRMSPIHHHFELGGWMETKVVFVFWMVGLVASVVGLLMMP